MLRFLQEWRENLEKSYGVGGILTEPSKAFDCIPHVLANLVAYGVDKFSFR